MDPETNYQTNHQFRRLPKGERRVRFADSMGMELVSIFLFDLINNYYFASIHNHHQLPPPKTIPKQPPSLVPPRLTASATQQQQATLKQQQDHQISPTIANNSIHPSKPAIISRTTLSAANHTILNNKFASANQTSGYHSRNSTNSIKLTPSQLKTPTLVSSQLDRSTSHHHYDHNQLQSSQNGSSGQLANFICEFTQPISLVSFKERVKLSKVHLETCSVNSRAGHTSVSCIIRVSNLSYDKSVIVRYTTDEWHTYSDSLASYKPGSCDGWSDKFTSTFSVTNQVKQFQAGQRIMFAVRITYDGDKVHWDNNGGLNYTIRGV